MSGLTDIDWKPFGVSDSGRTITTNEWKPPADDQLALYTDLFKCSGTNNLSVYALEIPASVHEDSVDCVRGSNYKFFNLLVKGSITIKGAIDGWLFKDSKIDGLIEVGQFDNYWFPGRSPTQGGVLYSTTKSDGTGCKVRLWDSTSITSVACAAEPVVTKIPWAVWFPYFLSQYVWVRLVNLTLPKDKKHPTS